MLVRSLRQKIIERLKERAASTGARCSRKVKALLERAADALTMREARRRSDGGTGSGDGRFPIARTSSARIVSHDECCDVHSMI
jgi:hypothetical protein